MKMGIIGFGGMGRWHQWLIESIDKLEIAGVWDIDQTAREKAIERGLKVYQSQEELLEQEEIEFVLIATPNDVHCSIAVAAMRALDAASLSNILGKDKKISFDLVVETMYETGKDLQSHYRDICPEGFP